MISYIINIIDNIINYLCDIYFNIDNDDNDDIYENIR